MKFQADLKKLRQILAYVVEEGQKIGVPTEPLGNMELCCEEALVNIISYGNPSEELEVLCHNSHHRFEVEIRDKGAPFNPIESEIAPEIDVPIEQRGIGGLGIYLIRTLLDESSYQRVGDENILRLTLRLDSMHQT